jgi:hypothetical protein
LHLRDHRGLRDLHFAHHQDVAVGDHQIVRRKMMVGDHQNVRRKMMVDLRDVN